MHIFIVLCFILRAAVLRVGYELLDCSFEVRLRCSFVVTLCQNAKLLGILYLYVYIGNDS